MTHSNSVFLIIVFSTFILFGCKQEEPAFTIETIERTLNNQDVYFIFTNTSMTSDAPVSASVISSSIYSRTASSDIIYFPFVSYSGDESSGIMSEIREFNQSDFLSGENPARSAAVSTPPGSAISPSLDDEGDTGIFYAGLKAPDDPDDPDRINATCRKKIVEHGIQLSIWVAVQIGLTGQPAAESIRIWLTSWGKSFY